MKSSCLFNNVPIDAVTEYRASEELVYRNLVSDLSGDVPLICKDLSKVINDSMSTLPPRCMEIFRMNRVERKTNREISVALGISEKAVEKQISKALRILSADLSASGFNPLVLVLFS